MQDPASQILIQHFRNPVGEGLISDYTFEGFSRNALCGDEIRLRLKTGAEGMITGLGWQARGCMLVRSSASVLAGFLANRPLKEAITIARSVLAWLEQPPDKKKPADIVGDVEALEQVRGFPARIGCVKLAWQTFLQAAEKE